MRTDTAMADRRRAERKGRTAELIAALFLILKGYRPMAWRVKTPRGEIDLIMKSRSHIVFVEVKTRRDIDSGLFAVSDNKAQRTLGAARIWLGRNARRLDSDYRFDILILAAYHWPRHIKNAYGADLW
jgi:putative endonuclease